MDKQYKQLITIPFIIIFLVLVSCMSTEITSSEITNTPSLPQELPTLSAAIISTIPGPLSTPRPSPTERAQLTVSDLQTSFMVLSVDREYVIIDPSIANEQFFIFASIRDEVILPNPSEMSQNGMKLLFTDKRPPMYKPRLMLYEFRNKSVIQLLQMSESQYWASLNQNGDQIAFVLHSDVRSDIYLIDSDGNNLQKIQGIQKWNVGPKWSPDGNSLYFLSSEEDATFKGYEMYKFDLNNGSIQRITNEPIKLSDYSFSPDGMRILYSSPQMGEDVYVMNVDGSNLQNLSSNYSRDTGASWSPDGSKIVFQSDRDGNWEVYLMNSDGSDQRRLTNDPEGDFNSMWSPNGDYIAFESERTGMRQTYLMLLEDESIHQITNTRNGSYLYFIWAPQPNSEIPFTCFIGMFEIGRTLRITDNGDNLSIRDEPSLTGEIIDLLSSGDEVIIIDGPHFDDGHLWWYVESVTKGIAAWAAENVDWFEPIDEECELPQY